MRASNSAPLAYCATRAKGQPVAVDRLDEAARLLLDTVSAEGRFKRAGVEFLAASRGLDQRKIIRRAACYLVARFPGAPMDRATTVIWKDAQRLFGWLGDVAELEPGGSA
jgi:hypothetical protein